MRVSFVSIVLYCLLLLAHGQEEKKENNIFKVLQSLRIGRNDQIRPNALILGAFMNIDIFMIELCPNENEEIDRHEKCYNPMDVHIRLNRRSK